MLDRTGLAIFCATSLGASIVLLTSGWVDLPIEWLLRYYIGSPVVICLLAGIAINFWRQQRSRQNKNQEPDQLTKFVKAAEFITYPWYKPLELSNHLLEESRELFGTIIAEGGSRYDANDLPQAWRYKISSEITADSLRITDSIVSQLRAGHPDTAMGTVRQLLELAMAVKIIAIDRTGETAKRYQDFDEANYLHKSVQHRSAPREYNFVRLSEIKREYGLERIPGQFAWILTSDGSRLRRMEQVIEFVAQHYDGEQTGQRFRYNQYMLLWEVLNKWGHMSRSASRRKLGTRSSEGYLREHLVEKSSVGLDAPLSLAILLLDSTLSTLAYIAFDLTGNEHNAELQSLEQLMKDIDASIDDVEPELLANDFRLRWPNTSSILE